MNERVCVSLNGHCLFLVLIVAIALSLSLSLHTYRRYSLLPSHWNMGMFTASG